MRNLIAATAAPLAFVIAAVQADPATANDCLHHASKWFEFQERKRDAWYSYHDAVHNRPVTSTQLSGEIDDLWWEASQVTIEVAKAKDSQNHAGSETVDFAAFGKAVWAKMDALDQARSELHEANLGFSKGETTVREAKRLSFPYFDPWGEETKIVLDLIKCVQNGR